MQKVRIERANTTYPNAKNTMFFPADRVLCYLDELRFAAQHPAKPKKWELLQ